jgi:hypothetical protein
MRDFATSPGLSVGGGEYPIAPHGDTRVNVFCRSAVRPRKHDAEPSRWPSFRGTPGGSTNRPASLFIVLQRVRKSALPNCDSSYAETDPDEISGVRGLHLQPRRKAKVKKAF